MAFLVRKIARAKWPDEDCKVDDLNGDAISDLKTTGNTLSLWKVNTIEELDSAALALAASSKSSKLESISIVWIPENTLLAEEIKIDDSNLGDTIISNLEHTHRDLCEITYRSLGKLSEIIIKGIQQDHCKRYTRAELKEVLVQAYNEDRICKEKCMPELLLEIEKAVAKKAKSS